MNEVLNVCKRDVTCLSIISPTDLSSLLSSTLNSSTMDKNLLEDQRYVQSKTPKRSWWMMLCAALATGWFAWPYLCCSPPLSIEDRVERILSQTPLIGRNESNLRGG